MKYSFEVRKMLLEKAMKECQLDSHVKNMEYKKDANTWAERIATGFHVKAGLPVKNSFMHCESLDMCFFYNEDMVPTVTYAGYTQDMKSDTAVLPSAFEKAEEVLAMMRFTAKEYDKEAEHGKQCDI
ncbi:hypothetical protein [Lacrimispora sp.]|uniref:hypothetical protein n=1 Tax=Lacrimispora sp. TaxID=2719234 RepID=UPI00345F7502